MRISDWSSDVCSSDLAQRWIDLDRPLYLHGLAYLSQDSGFFVRPPGTRSGLRQLLWGGFTYSELRKARDADVVAYLRQNAQIGRASCRERVCQYVEISVGAET